MRYSCTVDRVLLHVSIFHSPWINLYPTRSSLPIGIPSHLDSILPRFVHVCTSQRFRAVFDLILAPFLPENISQYLLRASEYFLDLRSRAQNRLHLAEASVNTEIFSAHTA